MSDKSLPTRTLLHLQLQFYNYLSCGLWANLKKLFTYFYVGSSCN
jgi:hypothetical protein